MGGGVGVGVVQQLDDGGGAGHVGDDDVGDDDVTNDVSDDVKHSAEKAVGKGETELEKEKEKEKHEGKASEQRVWVGWLGVCVCV